MTLPGAEMNWTMNAPSLLTLVTGITLGVLSYFVTHRATQFIKPEVIEVPPPPRPWLVDRAGYDWTPIEGGQYIRIVSPETADVWTVDEIDDRIGITGRSLDPPALGMATRAPAAPMPHKRRLRLPEPGEVGHESGALFTPAEPVTESGVSS
jgi:hypothetical protein